ncbi:MAG: hypothetical protein IKB99_02960 [Lentisphaeria bacterium]|nr:hypothetical protein [Lentisphaeria bacterium]
MKNGKLRTALPLAVLFIIGVCFVAAMIMLFDNSAAFRTLFSGDSSEVVGEVAQNSPASIAAKTRIAAWISMLIFSVITALQLLAFGLGFAVISNIKNSADSISSKLKQLDNAGIFFDVPLYVGLFGTVSAFLVMTFSPQSSRLIAYSSTLIGIVFSIALKLTMEYPFRQKLLRLSDDNKEGETK